MSKYISIPVPQFLRPLFHRSSSGQVTYMPNQEDEFGEIDSQNLLIAQNHPILTPGLLFVSKLYSQGKRRVIDTRTNEVVEDHWLNKLFDKPNPYQTAMDFEEEQMFMQLAQGKAVCWSQKTSLGSSEVDSLYFLDSSKITYPDGFDTKMVRNRQSKKTLDQKITYDKGGEMEKEIPLKDLLFFYDMPNGLKKNQLENKSRLDGIRQVLINSIDSQVAKNIILKSNGKEMITSKGSEGSFPLSPDDKNTAENLFNTSMGMAFGRKRGLVTKSDLTWTSMHIALRDLGLDESTKVDGNIIYTALHIPKDIISLEAKKTTYNNFKESMVSYIQNEINPSANAADQVYQQLIKDEPYMKVHTTYEHLPVMQFILKERYEVVKLQTEALTGMVAAGFPSEYALDLCGFKKDIQLTPPKPTPDEANNQQNSSTESE